MKSMCSMHEKHSVSQSARKLVGIIVILVALTIKNNARKVLEVSECKKVSVHHCVFTSAEPLARSLLADTWVNIQVLNLVLFVTGFPSYY